MVSLFDKSPSFSVEASIHFVCGETRRTAGNCFATPVLGGRGATAAIVVNEMRETAVTSLTTSKMTPSTRLLPLAPMELYTCQHSPGPGTGDSPDRLWSNQSPHGSQPTSTVGGEWPHRFTAAMQASSICVWRKRAAASSGKVRCSDYSQWCHVGHYLRGYPRRRRDPPWQEVIRGIWNPDPAYCREHCSRRFSLPSLHILHVRCKFCVIRAVGRNPQFLHV